MGKYMLTMLTMHMTTVIVVRDLHKLLSDVKDKLHLHTNGKPLPHKGSHFRLKCPVWAGSAELIM